MLKACAGSSCAEEGCGNRLLGNYEKTVRYASKNFWYAGGYGGFAQHAVGPTVKKAYLRPLCVFRVPEDLAARKAVTRYIRYLEGLWSDKLQSLMRKRTGVLAIATAPTGINAEEMVRLSMLTVEGEVTISRGYGGLNQISPLV